MTDTMFTRTALTGAACAAGVTSDQARTILEAAGVKVEPEMPALPTDPKSAIIATEVRGETGEWIMMADRDGSWFSPARAGGAWWHQPEDITKWTEARVIPTAATPVTLTEDQVGEAWDKDSVPLVAWTVLGPRNRERIIATVNAALAQHAAPAEGEPIDLANVRAGDRVRLELDSGDEATITVAKVGVRGLFSHSNAYGFSTIRAAYLLHREEA